jgi:hypothetical protein
VQLDQNSAAVVDDIVNPVDVVVAVMSGISLSD